MSEPVRDGRAMIAAMEPRLDPQRYCYMLVSPDSAPQALGAAIGTFREEEGVTAIVAEEVARELGETGPAFARVTLMVHSSLEGFGLTAAVSSLLAEHGIACNVIAAFHHDHLFVPAGDGEKALALLRELQMKHRDE